MLTVSEKAAAALHETLDQNATGDGDILRIAQLPVDALQRAHGVFQRLALLAELLRALAIAPDRRILGQRRDFGEALFLAVEVKDTS